MINISLLWHSKHNDNNNSGYDTDNAYNKDNANK